MTSTYSVSLICFDGRQSNLVLGLLSPSVSILEAFYIAKWSILFRRYNSDIFYCRPTFYRIYRKKSTEGFQSVPYLVALFSATLWLFYALLKQNAVLLITINTFGSAIETLYIAMYIVYATKASRVRMYACYVKFRRIKIWITFPCQSYMF